MWDYSEKVLDHYRNPRNVGKIDNADLIGEAGSLACGDSLKLYLKLDGDKIIDAKFQTFGCGSAVASSSILTEMIIGKTLDEAKKITNKDIAEELGGLPQEKMHCSVMGHEALEDALKKYYGDSIDDDLPQDTADKIVCTCFNVTENQIWEAIKVNNLKTVEEVTNYTKAGGACGRCKSTIKDIIDTYWKGAPKREDVHLTATQKILKISKVIEQQISPELQKDGGDIEFIDLDGNKVKVKLTGMCQGCKNSRMTIKTFVESILKEKVDSNLEVVQE
ncbi:Fe-S cluster assembly protein NifU [bacterium]|nr:Fe-S cluster assembly protein NifU [bacterium]